MHTSDSENSDSPNLQQIISRNLNLKTIRFGKFGFGIIWVGIQKFRSKVNSDSFNGENELNFEKKICSLFDLLNSDCTALHLQGEERS